LKAFIRTLALILIATSAVAGLPLKTSPDVAIDRTVRAYLASIEKDGSIPPEANEHISIVKMLAVIQKYKDFNADTTRIWAHVETSAWAVISQANKAQIFVAGKKPLIVIVPVSMRSVLGHSTSYFYNSQDEALYVTTHDVPDVWLAQVFYHEAGHAVQDKVDHLPRGVEGEVLMHTLSLQIVEAGVHGYREKIAEIASRAKDGTTYDAIASITTDDLKELDRMVFGDKRTRVLSEMSAFQIALAVGFRAAEDRGNSDLEARKAIYEWGERAQKSQK
jgi:hypothetical protein